MTSVLHALDERIVALDELGLPYPIGKLRAHVENVRHRAISVFLFSGARLLIQRRAAAKYHSGGLWANTCCSHPRWQEPADDCAKRRLREELGVDVALQPIGRIDYVADVGCGPSRTSSPSERLYENEAVECFAAQVDERALALAPDPDEVSATDWIELDVLADDAQRRPDRYAAWLRIYVSDHLTLLRNAAY